MAWDGSRVICALGISLAVPMWCLSPMSLLQGGSKSSEGVGWEEKLGVGREDHRVLWFWDSCR